MKATIENKTTSVTTHFKKLTTGKMCLLPQLLSKVKAHPAGITSNVQFVRLGGQRTQANDATDQWCDQ